ncbi:Polycystin cation channel, partial [Baffinella frigidus]
MSYLVFVAVFTWVVFNSQGEAAFMMVNDIFTALSSFEAITSIADWWTFHDKVFSAVVFPNTWYNGQDLDKQLLGNVNGKYALMGAVGLRQQRVKTDSCKIRDRFQSVTNLCLEDMSSSTEDRAPYGSPIGGSTLLTYQYKTAAELGVEVGAKLGCRLGGIYSGYCRVYKGGGFVEPLPSARSNMTLTKVKTRLDDLKACAGLWVDEQTRVLFTEFTVFNIQTVYNIQTDLVATVTLSLEMNAAGGIAPFIKVLPIKIGHLFPSEGSITSMAAEGLILLMVLAYTLQALWDWRKLGWKGYWANGWHYFDWVNFFLFYVAFSFRYSAMINAAVTGEIGHVPHSDSVKHVTVMLFYVAFSFRYSATINAAELTIPPPDTTFVYISGAGNSVEMWKNVMAANSFMTWFKIFKYFSHIPFMARLINVLAAASEDAFAFLICLGVVLFGFILTFYLTYGSYIYEFSTLTQTTFTLFRLMLGDWDFASMQKYNSVLGPVYFVLFTCLTMFMLLNMF